MEEAVRRLQYGTLAARIAVGNGKDILPQLDDVYRRNAKQVHDKFPNLCGLDPPNREQRAAVRAAMLQPFTLIQGPPGTGKTVTVVRLAALFVHVNQQLDSTYWVNNIKPQVMICGPSNKSVDVIAERLRRLRRMHKFSVVRVCSKSLEQQVYPIPRTLLVIRKPLLADPDEVEHQEPADIVLLHKIIRSLGGSLSSLAAAICLMDTRIQSDLRNNTSTTTDDELKEYQKQIAAAEKHVLTNADVILCTCTESASKRITQAANIQQLLVDECGMCKEAECLVPIVSSSAPQVVLAGDHRQLQPVVLEKSARSCGLARSLFERHSSSAEKLREQYRMHEEIMRFPSQQFYEDSLRVASEAQRKCSSLRLWPNGRYPFKMIDVVGKEKSRAVATVDSAQQSKYNLCEVTKVEAVVKQLTDERVPESDIAVLSQYRAQHRELELRLRTKYPRVAVSTVAAAQGSEWGYVVLSTVRSIPVDYIDDQLKCRGSEAWRRWLSKTLGMITDSHQINVAITRAKHGLVIIGNRKLLECCDTWKKLIDFYDLRGAIENIP